MVGMAQNLPPKPSPPLTHEELSRLKPISGVGQPPAELGETLATFFVAGSRDQKPEVTSRVSPQGVQDQKKGIQTYRIDIELTGGSFQGLPEPPRVPATVLRRSDLKESSLVLETVPDRPSFLDLSYFPERHSWHAPRIRAKDRNLKPLLIFPPDRRYIFYDTRYPWRTTGRVITAQTTGAGVLVGPRHLLTASHLVVWNNDNTTGWLQFAPQYFNGSTPFGVANAVQTYFYRKVGMPSGEYDVAEDYVVCVLDRRLGESLGWMGSKTYTEDWDDLDSFCHVGYSSDLGGGNVPSFQDHVSFEDADNPGFMDWSNDGLDIETETASLTPGDSGGPFFGWWSNAPYVVSVTSAEGTLELDKDNWAGGGWQLPTTVNKARSDFP